MEFSPFSPVTESLIGGRRSLNFFVIKSIDNRCELQHSQNNTCSHFVPFLFRYPNYEFLGDIEIAKTAGLSSRYSDVSLHGIIVDIYLLSLSDFLVCTFSSQVNIFLSWIISHISSHSFCIAFYFMPFGPSTVSLEVFEVGEFVCFLAHV
jgi:hypothetical protein